MEQTFIAETLEQLVAVIEAVLFVSREPVSEARLAELTGWDRRQVRDAVSLLEQNLAASTRGLCLLRVDGGLQLATKADFGPVIKQVTAARPPAPLSRAALETLAIIAYRQPVTKAVIDDLRGVQSSSAIYSLQERELIEEAGRAEAPGRPILYKTTPLFLHWCGLESLDMLPPLPESEAEQPTPTAAENPET